MQHLTELRDLMCRMLIEQMSDETSRMINTFATIEKKAVGIFSYIIHKDYVTFSGHQSNSVASKSNEILFAMIGQATSYSFVPFCQEIMEGKHEHILEIHNRSVLDQALEKSQDTEILTLTNLFHVRYDLFNTLNDVYCVFSGFCKQLEHKVIDLTGNFHQKIEVSYLAKK